MSYVQSLMSTGEEVQLQTRSHWISLAQPVLVYGTLTILLSAVASVAFSRADVEPNWRILGYAALLALLFPLALLIRDFAEWWTHRYVVTSRRVMQLSGVLTRRVSDSNLDKVNDIVMTQSLMGRALGYGDIEIITGSDIGVDILRRISDPIAFKRVMLDNKEDFDSLLSRMTDSGAEATTDVPGAIEQLASLRDRGLISPEQFEQKKAELLTRL